MTKAEKEKLILTLYGEAKDSSHIFPEMAVMEVLLETAWLTSKLAVQGNNLFGTKQSKTNPRFETLIFPTKEFLDGQWVTVNAEFISYPSFKESFSDRMNLLVRLSNTYKEYKDALNAKDNIEFIKEVSKKWSTDPLRAEKVLDMYNNYKYLFEETVASTNDKLSNFWQNFSSRFKKG